VQKFFGDDIESPALADEITPVTPLTLSPPSSPAPDEPTSESYPFQAQLSTLSDQLEILSSRFRSAPLPAPFIDLGKLPDAVQYVLSVTQHLASAVLPRRQQLPPNINSWNETAAVMPAAKKRKKKAGDAAYGAGETSGKKARTVKKKEAMQPAIRYVTVCTFFLSYFLS
jgi:hypothetical protein